MTQQVRHHREGPTAPEEPPRERDDRDRQRVGEGAPLHGLVGVLRQLRVEHGVHQERHERDLGRGVEDDQRAEAHRAHDRDASAQRGQGRGALDRGSRPHRCRRASTPPTLSARIGSGGRRLSPEPTQGAPMRRARGVGATRSHSEAQPTLRSARQWPRSRGQGDDEHALRRLRRHLATAPRPTGRVMRLLTRPSGVLPWQKLIPIACSKYVNKCPRYSIACLPRKALLNQN